MLLLPKHTKEKSKNFARTHYNLRISLLIKLYYKEFDAPNSVGFLTCELLSRMVCNNLILVVIKG